MSTVTSIYYEKITNLNRYEKGNVSIKWKGILQSFVMYQAFVINIINRLAFIWGENKLQVSLTNFNSRFITTFKCLNGWSYWMTTCKWKWKHWNEKFMLRIWKNWKGKYVHEYYICCIRYGLTSPFDTWYGICAETKRRYRNRECKPIFRRHHWVSTQVCPNIVVPQVHEGISWRNQLRFNYFSLGIKNSNISIGNLHHLHIVSSLQKQNKK